MRKLLSSIWLSYPFLSYDIDTLAMFDYTHSAPDPVHCWNLGVVGYWGSLVPIELVVLCVLWLILETRR